MKKACLRIFSVVFLFFFYLVGGNLSLHPTSVQAVSTVATAIPTAWNLSKQHNIMYNGTNFFVFYTKGSTEIYARGASSVSGLSSASEQGLTALAGVTMTAGTPWDLYWVDDTKFDLVYQNTTTVTEITTCTVSGTTISCGSPSSFTGASAAGDLSIARNSFSNKIWVAFERASGTFTLFEASTAGDATGKSYNSIANSSSGTTQTKSFVEIVPYTGSDKVLAVDFEFQNQSTSTDYYSRVCTTTCATSVPIHGNRGGSSSYTTATGSKYGSLIRVSDTDFRLALVDISATTNVVEAQFNGNATWNATFATIDNGGGQSFPNLFYDSVSGDEYAFYVDSGNHIQRYKKPSGGAWGSKTQVDGSEATANSIPVTQLVEPPPGSSRTTPRELSWCYRTANASNFNIICDHLNLASSGSLTLTAPGSAALGAVTLATSTQTGTGSLGTTTIADTRGTNVGWTLTATCSDFTASTHTITVSNLTINPNNSTLALVSGSLTGVTAGASHTYTSTSDAATIVSASNGNGNGQYTINPSLSLGVPVGSYAGSYTATITETLQ